MTVTLCVPVWNGEAIVEETLDSIRAQTSDDIAVLVSVDRSDDRSVDICRAFAARDARFEVAVQPVRLGWIGNVNWLLRHVQSEYASLTPHDDVLGPTYVERLLAELEARPDAVLAFCDLQFFGQRELVRRGRTATGDLFTRIVDFLHLDTTAIAWRGVLRTKVLAKGCYLEEVNGAAADQTWLLRLAIEGSLIRVPEVLYRKRLHADSVIGRSLTSAGASTDSHWADHCVSCHRIALAADSWTPDQSQAIAAACLVRAMRLHRVSALGSTASELASALLASITDYGMRLADLAPAGSCLMTSADVPERLVAHLSDRLGTLLAGFQPRAVDRGDRAS